MRRTLLAIPVVGLVAVAGYLTFDPFAASVEAQTNESAESTELRTSEVVVDTLVESDDYNGNLGFGDERQLSARAQGTLTWLPAEETTVAPGDVLWEIDRQPVIYMSGQIPMYRDLYNGVKKGDDVLQLEEFLIAEGFGPDAWEADTSFNRTTRNAVKAFQKDRGMTESGVLGPSQIVVGDEALRIADTANLGDDASAGPVLTVTDAVAEVTMAVSSRQLPTFQESPDVVIVLSDGSELDASLSETKATPPDEEGRFGYTLTYIVDDSIGEAQPVKIRVERTLAEDALTVPVDALVALAEGGYAVEVQTATGPVLRAVEVIDFDDTSVAITGDLEAGDLVVVP